MAFLKIWIFCGGSIWHFFGIFWVGILFGRSWRPWFLKILLKHFKESHFLDLPAFLLKFKIWVMFGFESEIWHFWNCSIYLFSFENFLWRLLECCIHGHFIQKATVAHGVLFVNYISFIQHVQTPLRSCLMDSLWHISHHPDKILFYHGVTEFLHLSFFIMQRMCL